MGRKFQSLVQTQLAGLNSALQAAGLQTSQFANERMASGAEQPSSQSKAQGAGSRLANNLVSELEQADQASGAAVNIQALGHE